MSRYIPDPHPDELIYSVWARFSDHVGYPSAGRVFQDLFGDRAVNPTVDLPCHLQKFCNNLPTEATLDIDSIIDHHTLLPYYRPFLSPEKYVVLREQMIAGSAHAIHRRMGISASSYVSRPLYLRYCPLCLEVDKATFGESYWHRLHQAPGVEICPDHDVFLEDSIYRTQSTLSQKAFVSAKRITNPASARDARSSPFYEQLKAIAENTTYLLNHVLLPRDTQVIRDQYHALLAKQGYLTLCGIVKVSRFLPDFQSYYPDALLALLHCEIDGPLASRNTWPILILGAKKRRHPLYHILTLLFLKSSVSQFLQEQVNGHPSTPFGQGPWPCLNPVCAHYTQLHIQTCQIRQINDPKGYSGIFSCDCGFRYSRIVSDAARSDIYQFNSILAYGPLWESTLCKLRTNSHLTCAQIAQRLGVSEATIRRKVNLLELPHRSEHVGRMCKTPSEAEIVWHREKWLTTVAAFPNEGISVAIRHSEGAYAWLKKHDRIWLDAHLPLRKPRRQPTDKEKQQGKRYGSGGGRKILPQEQEELDRVTAQMIRRRAKELLETPREPQRVTLRKLRREIPSFPDWPHNAAAFPLMQQALDEVLESSEHFAIRRVRWLAQQCRAERKSLTQSEFLREAGVRKQQHKPEVQTAIQEAMRELTPLG